MRTRGLGLLLAAVLLVTGGCANMSARQQRALSGGAVGAAGGAAVGAVTGGERSTWRMGPPARGSPWSSRPPGGP